MRKILLVGALVVGLCLLATVGNCADYKWTDKDLVTVAGKTGFARLEVEKVSFYFTHKIQPGEKLAVRWWIKNTGPCPLDVKVTVSDPGLGLNVRFLPGLSFTIGPGQRKNVALTVALPTGSPNWTANKSYTITVTFDSKEAGTKRDPDPNL